ncbi:DUF368 domain-containing protein [Spirochaeta dissipatitropha]
MNQKQAVFQVFQGMAIGIANVIPGVSGGTVAVILGIYDRLIESLADFFSRSGRWLFSFVFLLRIGMGAVMGVLLFSRLIDYLFTSVPVPTTLFFIGLVLGSVPLLLALSGKGKPGLSGILACLLTAAGIIILGNLQPEGGSRLIIELSASDAFLLFAAGALSLATMIIPGVSASFVLLVMGVYPSLLRAVNTLDLIFLGIFFAGGLVGILAVSKAIRALLRKHHKTSYYGILGLVLGSAVSLWPSSEIQMDLNTAIAFVCLIAGTALAVFFGWKKATESAPLEVPATTGENE